MVRYTIEKITQWMYVIFLGIFVLAGIVFAGVHRAFPFNVSFGVLGEDIVAPLVVMRSVTSPRIGDTLVQVNERHIVTHYTLKNVQRSEGVLMYGLVPIDGGTVRFVPARTVSHAYVFAVPLLGLFVHAVQNTIGVMAVFGIPLAMLFIQWVTTFALPQKVLRRVRAIFTRAHNTHEESGVVTTHLNRIHHKHNTKRSANKVEKAGNNPYTVVICTT